MFQTTSSTRSGPPYCFTTRRPHCSPVLWRSVPLSAPINSLRSLLSGINVYLTFLFHHPSLDYVFLKLTLGLSNVDSQLPFFHLLMSFQGFNRLVDWIGLLYAFKAAVEKNDKKFRDIFLPLPDDPFIALSGMLKENESRGAYMSIENNVQQYMSLSCRPR